MPGEVRGPALLPWMAVPWLRSIAASAAAIAAVAGVFALVAFAPGLALWIFLAGVFALPIGWMIVSTLLPARLDRNCPACSAWALEPLDPEDRYGVRCAECGFEDPTIPGARLGHEPPAR